MCVQLHTISALYTCARISQSVRAPCFSRFIFTQNFRARVFKSFLSYGNMPRAISSVSVYRKFLCGCFDLFSFENSLFKKLMSNGALWIIIGESPINSNSSSAIESNDGLSSRKSCLMPCILVALSSISIGNGFTYVWKWFPDGSRFINSTHAISIMPWLLLGSFDFRHIPVVSVSNMISLI